jgi:hypothetical protein
MNINRPCGTFDRTYFQAKELYRTRCGRRSWGSSLSGCMSYPSGRGLWDLHSHPHLCFYDRDARAADHHRLLCQISIGHAAFMGIGMYTVAIMQRHLVLASGFVCRWPGLFPCSLECVGLPALRMKGYTLPLRP